MRSHYKGLPLSEQFTGFCLSGTANAQQQSDNVDLGSLSCRTLLQIDGEERANKLIFFPGYVTGQKSQRVTSISALPDVSGRVANWCIDEASKTLISAFESEAKERHE